MFARQIAVMKGQAWNVVETLKTSDHGPLELTRRARVCVWDDLVEIPVATPMRPSSEGLRRKTAHPVGREGIAEEEMDISAAYASAPPLQNDLLGLGEHDPNASKQNRFNISRQNSSNDVRPSEEDTGPLSPSSISNFTFDTAKESGLHSRPTMPQSKTRLSLDETRRLFDNLGDRRRRFSISLTRRGTYSGLPNVEDDLEGDLGFAAAEDQDGNRRKVIIERLETVKSKNPTFTWC